MGKRKISAIIPKDHKVAEKIKKEIKGKTVESIQFVRREGESSFYGLNFTDGTVLRLIGKVIMFGTEVK